MSSVQKGLVAFFLFALVPFAFAETIELVTYFPAGAGGGGGGGANTDPQFTSIRVGNDYADPFPLPADGTALIRGALAIGIPPPGGGAPIVPKTMLDVRGQTNLEDVNGAGTIYFRRTLPPGSPLTQPGLFIRSDDDPATYEAASERLFIGANGRIGIGTTNPAAELDVVGDLFVRNAVGSNNHVRIRGPSDANTAIELRAEAAVGGNPGTPYIDFANDGGVNTDFDARLILIGNDDLLLDGSALQVHKDGGADQTLQLARYDNDLVPTTLSLLHGRGTSAAPLRPQGNDGLGFIRFQGVNTAAQNFDGATIQAVAAANWTAASAPAALIFSTTPAGAAGSVERMRITEEGRVLIGTDILPPTAPTTMLAVRRDADELVFARVENTNSSANAAARLFVISQLTAPSTPISIGMDSYSQAFNPALLGNFAPGNTAVATFAGALTGMPANLGNLFIVSRGTNQRIAFHTGSRDINAASERMRITNVGNVGIGTANPAQRLDVTGNAIIRGSLQITNLPGLAGGGIVNMRWRANQVGRDFAELFPSPSGHLGEGVIVALDSKGQAVAAREGMQTLGPTPFLPGILLEQGWQKVGPTLEDIRLPGKTPVALLGHVSVPVEGTVQVGDVLVAGPSGKAVSWQPGQSILGYVGLVTETHPDHAMATVLVGHQGLQKVLELENRQLRQEIEELRNELKQQRNR